MSVFFDTSCLVAAFVSGEPQNASCLACLQRYENQAAVAAHSLAECFHVLTGRKRISPVVAAQTIKANVIDKFAVVTLTRDEYAKTLMEAPVSGIRGGAIYDALILAAARKIKATRIFTLCAADFRTFAPDLAEAIRQP